MEATKGGEVPKGGEREGGGASNPNPTRPGEKKPPNVGNGEGRRPKWPPPEHPRLPLTSNNNPPGAGEGPRADQRLKDTDQAPPHPVETSEG